jgi:hypothetical protein
MFFENELCYGLFDRTFCRAFHLLFCRPEPAFGPAGNPSPGMGV